MAEDPQSQYNQMGADKGAPAAGGGIKDKIKGCCSSPFCKKVWGVIITALVLIVVGIIIFQLITWEVGAGMCKPSKLTEYDYNTWPTGAQDVESDGHNTSWNVLGEYVSLVDNTPKFAVWQPQYWFGMESLTVYPSTVNAAPTAGGSTGNFWRTQGPFFNTYVYDQMEGLQLLMGREKLLTLGISHQFWKCDGTGPTIIVSEGIAWLGNRVRQFFGTSQGFKFNIYMDGDFIGLAQETGSRFNPGISFTSTDAKGAVHEWATSTLASRDFHGNMDQWYVRSQSWSKVPYYAPVFTTLILAIRTAHVKQTTPTPPPHYLVSEQEQSSDFSGLQSIPAKEETAKITESTAENTAATEKTAKVAENSATAEERVHV